MNQDEARGDGRAEAITDKFRRAIGACESYEFSLTPLDRLGVPLYCVGLWTEEGVYYDGFGYGAGEAGARAGAWGEVLENYLAGRGVQEMARTRASYEELRAAGRHAVEPPRLCLDAGCDYAPGRELHWVEVNNFSGAGGGKTLVPLEAAAIHPLHAPEIAPEKLLFRPITNGLGAGASLAQAVAHGALETVQRDGNCVAFRAMDAGCRIELDAVRSEETRALLALLDAHGIEIIPKLAGVVAGIPVVHVVGHDRDLRAAEFPMQISACGEAAHPDREVALAKALREYVSGRARKHFMHGPLDRLERVAPAAYVRRMLAGDADWEEGRAVRAVMDWATSAPEEIFRRIERPILETRSTVKFSELPTREFAPGDWDSLLAHLRAQFAELGTEILYADFSDGAPAGVHVVHAIVPGMEGETMSYGRIGRRNLERLLERQRRDPRVGRLVGYGAGERPASARAIHLTEEDAARFPGAWLDPEAVAAQVGDFYALYREPESFAIGRLLERRAREAKQKGATASAAAER